MSNTFADRITDFYLKLASVSLDTGRIVVMNPYRDEAVKTVIQAFHAKFFNDNHPRVALFGINPGRFGAGITGIPFTDPIHLEQSCGIPNSFEKRHELSSEFVYNLVETYGGVHDFYKQFLLTAVSPLGFTQQGKNLNYYDRPALMQTTETFIKQSIEQQISIGLRTDACFSLGKGKNLAFLQKLNEKYQWFEKIIPLGHPRWVMQYRRKQAAQLAEEYCELLRKVG